MQVSKRFKNSSSSNGEQGAYPSTFSRCCARYVWVVAPLNGPQRAALTNFYIRLDIELCKSYTKVSSSICGNKPQAERVDYLPVHVDKHGINTL